MSDNNSSALAPFKHRVFAVMWLAMLISNVGTWMQSVGAGWLMTELSPSSLIVALVQTATTLPIFLFAIFAGALADIVNRRQLLLVVHWLMFAVSLLFAFAVWSGYVNTISLLVFTFLLGMGGAFVAPAWQAIIPKMVSKAELPQAVALGGISINISRAIGPALAGIVIAVYGLSSPFIANAISFVFVLAALYWWTYIPDETSANLPSEHVLPAIKTGMRYAVNSDPLKAVIWHVLGFMFFANAYWGLLPVIAKDVLNGDAAFFGILMGVVGFGAVAGALLLPRLKKRLNPNQLVAIGSTITSVVIGLLAVTRSQPLAVLTSLVFGFGWILVLANLNVAAQQALPDWVRARGLSIFMMVFFGSMSLGAAFWGWFADYFSITDSMLTAGIGGVLFLLLSYRKSLCKGADLDFTPSHHWPEPPAHHAIGESTGAVIVQIQYQVDPEQRAEFLQAVQALKQLRLRNGAHSWGVYESTEIEGQFVEQFREDSWIEHLRHHEHVALSDKPLQEAVARFHRGEAPPVVQHLLYCNPLTGN